MGYGRLDLGATLAGQCLRQCSRDFKLLRATQRDDYCGTAEDLHGLRYALQSSTQTVDGVAGLPPAIPVHNFALVGKR